jgi:hypothetical protein
MVRELSLRTGMIGDEHGRVVWADIAWDYAAPTENGLSQPASPSPSESPT